VKLPSDKMVTIDEVRDSFLSMFKMIDPNNKYLPVKIASFYYIIGQVLVKRPIVDLVGEIDMRFSHGICIKSGRGKDAIKNVTFQVANKLGMRYSEFTSLHEEQLVGKKWIDKATNEEKEVLGYFSDDFVEKDDGLVFINSDRYETARNYWLSCLSTYGKNYICKRLTEMDSGIKYLGTASLRFFIQPSEKVKVRNLTSGLFRRCPVLRVDLTKADERIILERRLKEEFKPHPKEFLDFVAELQNHDNITHKEKKLNEYDLNLIDILYNTSLSYQSDNEMLSTLLLDTQNTIIKWSLINALLRNYILKTYRVKRRNSASLVMKFNEGDLNRAITDYRVVHSAIERFVFGNISYNTLETEIIDFINNESRGLSTPKVIGEVARITGSSEATVTRHFYKLRKNGIIKTKQLNIDGVKTSKVWI